MVSGQDENSGLSVEPWRVHGCVPPTDTGAGAVDGEDARQKKPSACSTSARSLGSVAMGRRAARARAPSSITGRAAPRVEKNTRVAVKA